MKIISFTHNGTARWGLLQPDGIAPMDHLAPTVKSAVEAGLIASLPSDTKATLKPDEIALTLPLPDPGKIICVGVNFPDRNAEYKDGVEAPPNMSLFPRFPQSFTAHDQPLIRPPESEKLDYEGEIAIVIGTGGRRIAEADAWSHVAAATLCNEGTIRDWVRHAKFNVTQGKNWDRSGAMGPYLTPITSADQLADIRLTTHVNGELRQDDSTSRMLFPIPRQIAYISTFTTLHPGDIIVTGTPTGAGARFDPPRYLEPGDVIKVTAEGLGTLRNTVEDE
ncbi:fumarylacetoacetate hydrolase family protein [Pseudaestuariivita atlantica]|uniref:2-hydroxyhepta-2,4-diene-1,7-dioate isomerase n=1 Tax=Pseudaestuariivita atlantica TaxID=1317121 RepID=A0A0L1JU00_9RHOB|nr:fumarylacetoacetate hydrolase family protein [Pseudaestuariivita atlantica]KNG94883.1 2-hydroxyhepta-2,4-diene-1,7-dioate isomerase [Pseudaestuariivita atlantica]